MRDGVSQAEAALRYPDLRQGPTTVGDGPAADVLDGTPAKRRAKRRVASPCPDGGTVRATYTLICANGADFAEGLEPIRRGPTD